MVGEPEGRGACERLLGGACRGRLKDLGMQNSTTLD